MQISYAGFAESSFPRANKEDGIYTPVRVFGFLYLSDYSDRTRYSLEPLRIDPDCPLGLIIVGNSYPFCLL